MTAQDGRPTGPTAGTRPGQVAADLLLVGSVPLVLAAVHLLLPPAVQEAYVLRPDAATPVTLFTAAYLHVSDAHLLANVVGYGLGALSAYLLCLLLAERRWFRLSTLALLFGLPVLVNWTSLLVLDLYFVDWSGRARGFSGVAAGFGGFALAALLAFVGRRTDRGTALFAGPAVLLLLLLEVLVIYAGEFPPTATALVALGVGLCLFEASRRWRRRGLPETRAEWLAAGLVALVVAWTLLVVGWIVAGLFPADVVDGGNFTNIFAHAIGFGYGFVVSGWGYRYWRTTYP